MRPENRSETENNSREIDTIEFRALVRYIGPQDVFTIPKKVSREIGIKLGDIVKIQIRKTREVDRLSRELDNI